MLRCDVHWLQAYICNIKMDLWVINLAALDKCKSRWTASANRQVNPNATVDEHVTVWNHWPL